MATADQIRDALIADGYTDPPATGDEYLDPASPGWLPDGQTEIVTITGVWKIQAGWSTTVVRRRVDAGGNTVPSGCGEGRIFVDHLIADYRRVEA